MKKGLIIFFITFLILNLFFIKAQDPSVPIVGDSEEKVNKLNNVVDNLSNNNTRVDFLKKQGDPFFEKIKINQITTIIKNIFITGNLTFSFSIDEGLSLDIKSLKLGDMNIPKIFQNYLKKEITDQINKIIKESDHNNFISGIYIENNKLIFKISR